MKTSRKLLLRTIASLLSSLVGCLLVSKISFAFRDSRLACIVGRFFLDHVKAADDLQTFGKLNESRLYKLMQSCVDPNTDLKTLVKSMVRLFLFHQSFDIRHLNQLVLFL